MGQAARQSQAGDQGRDQIARMESPLQKFARWITRDAELSDGAVVPAGSRVTVSYASASRDERQFADPDLFSIDRAEMRNPD